jgi:hypothetical protein
MAFDLKMFSEVVRSLASSSGKLRSTMSLLASNSQLEEYDGFVLKAVGQADGDNIRDQGPWEGGLDSDRLWRVIPAQIV